MCNGCKRFQANAFKASVLVLLPKDRTEESRVFQVIGTDFAGSLLYKLKSKMKGKVYILIFAFRLSCAIHLQLLTNQTVEEFIRSRKCFTTRRGRRPKIYSDNPKTFQAASKWLNGIIQYEKLHD